MILLAPQVPHRQPALQSLSRRRFFVPSIILNASDTNVTNLFFVATAMDTATITSASATSIVMSGGGRSYTLTGTGFTTTVIGGVQYINSGTIDTIEMSNGVATYQLTQVAMLGSVLGTALREDRTGVTPAALESLFLLQSYVIFGTTGVDQHFDNSLQSIDGFDMILQGFADYFLGDGDDYIENAGINDDSILGEGGNDILFGQAGRDSLFGGLDNDYLHGLADNDSLSGGAGIDNLFGGDGADILNGDADNDTVEGGAGNDLMFVAPEMTI